MNLPKDLCTSPCRQFLTSFGNCFVNFDLVDVINLGKILLTFSFLKFPKRLFLTLFCVLIKNSLAFRWRKLIIQEKIRWIFDNLRRNFDESWKDFKNLEFIEHLIAENGKILFMAAASTISSMSSFRLEQARFDIKWITFYENFMDKKFISWEQQTPKIEPHPFSSTLFT